MGSLTLYWENKQIKRIKQNEDAYQNRPVTEIIAPEPVETRERDKFRRLMTSQLTALWLDTKDDDYKEEFLFRIKMCGLSDAAARNWLDYEAEMLKGCPHPEMLSDRFISAAVFSLSHRVLPHSVSYYQTNFDYPLSYVIKISDEAEWHFGNSHERNLPNDVWEEIYSLSDKNRKLSQPFFIFLTQQLGWTVDAVNKYSYNEQGMLDYYRWGRKSRIAAKEPWGMKTARKTE